MIRLTCLFLLAAGTALAAGPPDPDWPCIQRRQPSLSLAQVWAGPPPDPATLALAETGEVQSVARVVALRRTAMDEARAMIDRYAEGRDPAAVTALFVATLEHVNTARNRVMAGITRYAHKQEALEVRIEELRRELVELNAAEPKDFDRIDAVEGEIEWSTRIFQDRQQSLAYVCETPVILEQRAFALGREMAEHLPE